VHVYEIRQLGPTHFDITVFAPVFCIRFIIFYGVEKDSTRCIDTILQIFRLQGYTSQTSRLLRRGAVPDVNLPASNATVRRSKHQDKAGKVLPSHILKLSSSYL
jgi:hypothetical protein